MNHYDVIVIGSGPGGEGAAMKAAKEGKRVAVIDDYQQVGGNCTHRGTIPSKALRQAIVEMSRQPLLREAGYQQMLQIAAPVIRQQVSLRSGFYDRNHVEVIQGRARFVDANTVYVIKLC